MWSPRRHAVFCPTTSVLSAATVTTTPPPATYVVRVRYQGLSQLYNHEEQRAARAQIYLLWNSLTIHPLEIQCICDGGVRRRFYELNVRSASQIITASWVSHGMLEQILGHQICISHDRILWVHLTLLEPTPPPPSPEEANFETIFDFFCCHRTFPPSIGSNDWPMPSKSKCRRDVGSPTTK